MTQTEAKKIIEPLESKYQKSALTGQDILSRFSDIELLAYIALATFAWGRSWNSAIENAQSHLLNRDKAIKLFGTQQQDLLGA